MEYEDITGIIRKLIHDTLTEKERCTLQTSPPVTALMEHQWEDAPDAVVIDRPDEQAIWRKIYKLSRQKDVRKRLHLYKVYSYAASCLLLFALSVTVYYTSFKPAPESTFIVSSGLRNIENISLPDGTNVQLGPGSRLSYPSAFNHKTRDIYLDGQAFFDVAKNPRQPFIVHTADMKVEALGTAFELFSYEKESHAEVILVTGSVKVGVRHESREKEEEYILLPDRKLELDRQTGEVSSTLVDADRYTSWSSGGTLSFENEQLSMIIPRLEQWFKREIKCEQELAEQYRFTFKVRDESLERILSMIEAASSLKYVRLNGNGYVLTLK